MSVVFDILSLITAGIGDSIKGCKLFNFAKKHTSSAGIVFLQETHSSEKVKDYGYISGAVEERQFFFSHGSSNDMGALIAFGDLLDYKILSVTYDISFHIN